MAESPFGRQAAPFRYIDALDLRLPGPSARPQDGQDEGHAFGFVRRQRPNRDAGWPERCEDGAQGFPPHGPQGAERGFRGLGPRGYRRPDARIREEVCDRLTDDDAIDARGISVDVVGGEVILRGHVASWRMRRAAGLCAGGCSGVRRVRNALRVGGG